MTLSADRTRPLVSLRTAGPVVALEGTPPAGRAVWQQARPAGVSPPFARVTVCDTIAAAAAAWESLQAVAPASPYQTIGWARAWIATEGKACGIRPLIGIAFDARGAPVALMPLGLRRTRLITVATFLGGRHANYNLGLFAPGVAWTAADIRHLLDAIAADAPRKPDVLALFNQPFDWQGWANPLALLPHQASPSSSHRVDLDPDGEAFWTRQTSATARKKLRGKLNQLATIGPVAHRVARTPVEIAAVLDAYATQKSVKLAAMGAGPDAATFARTLAFFARAATDGTVPVLELHSLTCGDRIVATFGGLLHAGRFSGLMTSHESDATFARLSPGEILMSRVMQAQCAAGVASLDLGIGEARYKQSLCPIEDPLFDTFLPVSLRGRLFVAGEAVRLRLKRAIKQSSWAWPLLLAARRHLAALRRCA